jgi:hypothetical protein
VIKFLLVLSLFTSTLCFGQLHHIDRINSRKQDKFFDSTHAYISEKILLFGQKFDSLFGDAYLAEEEKGSRLIFNQIFTTVRHEPLLQETVLKAKFVFPNLKKKLRLEIGKSNDISSQQAKFDNVANIKAQKKQNDYSVGLKYNVLKFKNWNFNLKSGVLIRDPLNPFIKSRGNMNIPLGSFVAKLKQQFFYYDTEGYGVNLNANFNRKISDKLSFQFENFFQWLNSSDTISGVNGPSFYQRFSKRRAMSYHIKVFSESKPEERIIQYSAFIKYRQTLHKKWLIAELIPSLDYYRETAWHPTPSLTLKVIMIFGDSYNH